LCLCGKMRGYVCVIEGLTKSRPHDRRPHNDRTVWNTQDHDNLNSRAHCGDRIGRLDRTDGMIMLMQLGLTLYMPNASPKNRSKFNEIYESKNVKCALVKVGYIA